MKNLLSKLNPEFAIAMANNHNLLGYKALKNARHITEDMPALFQNFLSPISYDSSSMSTAKSGLNSESLGLVRSVGVLAESLGVVAYLVGGPVRDLMLGLPNIDLDITVEGNGIRLAEAFVALHRGAKLVKYPAFKTASVCLSDGTLIDFATARKETYVRGGAFPAVKPSDIKDDLLRRDFTINAMALSVNPKTWGKLFDPFGGKVDLRYQRLRILHDNSFVDDPTRILRAARFMARLDFKMEAKSLKLLKSALKIKVLDTIRPQRYLKDFNKILKEPKSLIAVEYLKSWGAYKSKICHPERRSS